MKKRRILAGTKSLVDLVREANTLVDDFHRVVDALGESTSVDTWQDWLIASLENYGEEIASEAGKLRQ